jgi:hypothetical protein
MVPADVGGSSHQVDYWSAVLGVAAVAAVGVLRHAYDLVQAHDEAGWSALRHDSPAVLSG